MQQFDCTIKHRPGSQNVVPDALSRDIASISVECIKEFNLMSDVQKNPDKYTDFKIENGVMSKHILDQSAVGDYMFGWRIYVSSDKIEP